MGNPLSPLPITVVKLGGALVADPAALDALWKGVMALHETERVVIIHGGGPQATALARRLGHEPRIVHGRRVTTDLDLDVMKWTLRGALNGELVASANAHGLRAVGLSGADGQLVRVKKRPPVEIDGETVDFGHVGDLVRVEPGVLSVLLDAGYVPIVASLSADEAGRLYNVNADTVACAIASALKATRFLLATESGGVRRDAEDAATHLPSLDEATFESGIRDGWIGGGMRVKLSVAFDARRAGISDVHIVAPDDLVERTRGTAVQ